MLGYFLPNRPEQLVSPAIGAEAMIGAQIGDISAPKSKSIFLLGLDPVLEHGLCEYLWSVPQFDLSASHYDVKSALKVVDAVRPDIVIVHIGSTETDRIAFIDTCRLICEQCIILVHLSREGLQMRGAAFDVGATDELVDLEDVMLCHHVINRTIAACRSDTDATRAVLEPEETELLFEVAETIQLLPIEHGIAHYLADGKTISEIAHHVGLPAKSIALHRSRIRQSLGCRTNQELGSLLARYLPLQAGA